MFEDLLEVVELLLNDPGKEVMTFAFGDKERLERHHNDIAERAQAHR